MNRYLIQLYDPARNTYIFAGIGASTMMDAISWAERNVDKTKYIIAGVIELALKDDESFEGMLDMIKQGYEQSKKFMWRNRNYNEN